MNCFNKKVTVEQVMEQIKIELAYARTKHPDQDLSMEKAVSLAQSYLYPNNKTCFGCMRCEETICFAFAAIAILIKGILNSANLDHFKERENHIKDELYKLLIEKKEE